MRRSGSEAGATAGAEEVAQQWRGQRSRGVAIASLSVLSRTETRIRSEIAATLCLESEGCWWTETVRVLLRAGPTQWPARGGDAAMGLKLL